MNVKYTEYFDNGESETKNNEVCFSIIYSREPNIKTVSISYTCPVAQQDRYSNKFITFEDVQKYCAFLDACLDNKLFTFTIRQGTKGIEIDWVLNTKGMSRPMALMYLTAFRYPDEFSSYVLAISESTKQTIEENFEYFSQCHIDSLDREGKKRFHYADGGHSLMGHSMIPNAQRKPISFEDFKTNLKKGKSKTVLGFWQKTAKE